MAHNVTLNYGGATPCMSVFGILPRGFYDPESAGVLSYTGSVETDVTPFERAIRIRQTALAQTHQAVIEDRLARANRTKPHQLNLGELIAGTSEVEFYREVQGDPGWRGPALLLRLDADDGVAVVQYQGKPYLISLRFLRPYRGIFHMTVNKEEPEENLFKLMKVTESMADCIQDPHLWLADEELYEDMVQGTEGQRFRQQGYGLGRRSFKSNDEENVARHHDGQGNEELQTSEQHYRHTGGVAERWTIPLRPGTQELQPPPDEEDQQLCSRRHLYDLLLLLQHGLCGGHG